MNPAGRAVLTTLAVSLGQLALAQGHMHHKERPSRAADAITGPAAPYSAYPTPVIDGRGRLWVAFNEGQHVYVTSSTDQGRTFGRAVRVNAEPEKMDANGEGRPKVAVKDDLVFVSWTQKGERPFTGFIRFARSSDCGKTFTAPITVNDDGVVTGHRFDTLGLGPKGEVVIAWIDKRDLEAAKQKGVAYEGAAIYYAVSRDGGKNFEPNKKLKDGSCECCRMALAFEPDGTPVLLWRDIFAGGIRDHAVARLDGSASVRRASFDGWKIQGCRTTAPRSRSARTASTTSPGSRAKASAVRACSTRARTTRARRSRRLFASAPGRPRRGGRRC